MNLSPHFTLAELTRSDYAIRKGLDNTPDAVAIENLRRLCNQMLEPVRELIGLPLRITSGYRSRQVNSGVGGSKNSAHIYGRAADFEVMGVSHIKVIQRIATMPVKFDQLIWEFGDEGWIHIGIGGVARGEILEAYKTESGQTRYRPLLLPGA